MISQEINNDEYAFKTVSRLTDQYKKKSIYLILLFINVNIHYIIIKINMHSSFIYLYIFFFLMRTKR